MHVTKEPATADPVSGDPSSSAGAQFTADTSTTFDANNAMKRMDVSKLNAQRIMILGMNIWFVVGKENEVNNSGNRQAATSRYL